jgi:hypothetical protein
MVTIAITAEALPSSWPRCPTDTRPRTESRRHRKQRELRGFEPWTSELTFGIFSRRASRFWRFVIPVVIRAGNAAKSIDSTEYDKSTVGTLSYARSARSLALCLTECAV